MPTTVTTQELLAMKDHQLEPSRWVEVGQDRIDLFAEATEDHQFIHVDLDRSTADIVRVQGFGYRRLRRIFCPSIFLFRVLPGLHLNAAVCLVHGNILPLMPGQQAGEPSTTSLMFKHGPVWRRYIAKFRLPQLKNWQSVNQSRFDPADSAQTRGQGWGRESAD